MIVDGRSDDGTIDIAKVFGARVEHGVGTVRGTRKTAFDTSEGKIVVQLETDIVSSHDDWLLEAIYRFNYGKEVTTVRLKNIAPLDATPITKLYFRHWEPMMEECIAKWRGFFSGGNILFQRSCLEDSRSINAELRWGEDFDWAKRLHSAGYSIGYHRDPIYLDTMRSLRRVACNRFVGAEWITARLKRVLPR